MTCFLHRLIKAFKFHWEVWVKETPEAIKVDGKLIVRKSKDKYMVVKDNFFLLRLFIF